VPQAFFLRIRLVQTPTFATRGARDGERSGRELREQSILRSLNGGKKVSNIYSKARGTCQMLASSHYDADDVRLFAGA
jgi:hypothetical protein